MIHDHGNSLTSVSAWAWTTPYTVYYNSVDWDWYVVSLFAHRVKMSLSITYTSSEFTAFRHTNTTTGYNVKYITYILTCH